VGGPQSQYGHFGEQKLSWESNPGLSTFTYEKIHQLAMNFLQEYMITYLLI